MKNDEAIGLLFWIGLMSPAAVPHVLTEYLGATPQWWWVVWIIPLAVVPWAIAWLLHRDHERVKKLLEQKCSDQPQ